MIVPKNKRASGFTLLEILIALLIVSIGLLGVATLLVRGQQFTQVAYFRTQATFLAYDLMDRIRINFNLMTTGNNTSYDTGGFVNEGPLGKGPVDSCDNAPCSTFQLKDYDLTNWLYLLRESLPSVQAKIVSGNKNHDDIVAQYTITICWKDVADNQSPSSECPEKIGFEQQEWILQL